MKKTRASAEKYFRRYLRIGPIALAIWRSVEARHMADIPLKRPILDIGCGFGEFALAFFDEPADVGIDINAEDLKVAEKTKKYKKLVLGDARKMPFKDNTFGSVMSISTFEHITDSIKLVKEAYRVLKPGGILAITLETDEVDPNTFYRPTLKKIGLGKITDVFTYWYNTMYNRHTLSGKKYWKKLVADVGFEIEVSKDIISVKVTKLFDIFLVTAWPSQIPKLFFGRRMVWRPKFMEDLITKMFLKTLDEEETCGTNLLIVARKPIVIARNDGGVTRQSR